MTTDNADVVTSLADMIEHIIWQLKYAEDSPEEQSFVLVCDDGDEIGITITPRTEALP
jgi:hypothetical protein